MLKQEIGFFDRKENGVGALCARLSSEAAQVQGVLHFHIYINYFNLPYTD